MSKRKLELRDQRGKLDTAISDSREAIDGHARACRYRDLAAAATQLATHARAADACKVELDKILEAEWAARRRG